MASGIHIKASKIGSLHKLLGISTKNKIPTTMLASKPGDSPAMAKKKNFARNARHFNHHSPSLHKLMGS